jgi:hypothetical protein
MLDKATISQTKLLVYLIKMTHEIKKNKLSCSAKLELTQFKH